jgi:uncharacterized protein YerC
MGAKKLKLMPLEDALKLLASRSEAKQLLSILLSPHEIKSVNKRWLAFQMVLAGRHQRAIGADLHISTTTVSRAARVIGGSAAIVRRLVARIH